MTSRTGTGERLRTASPATAATVLQAMTRSLTPFFRRKSVISTAYWVTVSTDLTP
jgi:hypothetical protein